VTLIDRAFEIVSINSVSGNEAQLASLVFDRLRSAPHLEVERIGDNVVARTMGHHRRRLIVAGHLDTVPGHPEAATLSDGTLRGLGACDMKGSLAVMLERALDPTARSIEVTWVFYAREEIARSQSGLIELKELRPDLLVADAALLAEPTNGVVEAGCQGTLRVGVTLRGARAHTARPFMGRNAIHRLGELIARVAAYQPREAVIDGIVFTEQIQIVMVSGGVAANVVPDEASCTINHRFAPDRTAQQAAETLRSLLGDAIEDNDLFQIIDSAPAAPPSLAHDVIKTLVTESGENVRAKVGWTDVATFYEMGVPAANFGAGDPLLAHHSDEFVTAAQLEHFDHILTKFLAAV
jgi:succinyl-diaminopimelate desuccinylase